MGSYSRLFLVSKNKVFSVLTGILIFEPLLLLEVPVGLGWNNKKSTPLTLGLSPTQSPTRLCFLCPEE